MRELIITPECAEFIENSSQRTKAKFDYLVELVIEQNIIPKNFVEKLVDTQYHELKIKTDNQIRIILFTFDTANIHTCKEVIFLNGFMKRENKDYKKAIKIADKLLNRFLDEKE